MASPNVIELTTDNWDEHVSSGTLVQRDGRGQHAHGSDQRRGRHSRQRDAALAARGCGAHWPALCGAAIATALFVAAALPPCARKNEPLSSP